MPVYEYKGFGPGGKAVKGIREADGAKTLRALLRKDGIMVTDVVSSSDKGEGGAKKKGFLSSDVDFSRFQSVSVDDIGLATRQLATLLQAGVTMIESLNALIEQVENGALKRVLAEVKTDVNGGMSFANALEKHKIFDHIFVNM